MKKSKIMSIILSGVMGISMFSGFITASAAYGLPPVINELVDEPYTLSELFNMSDEEFLKLEGAQSFYNIVKGEASDIALTGQLYNSVLQSAHQLNPMFSPKYKANVTEEEIAELIGDTVKYRIESPICLTDDEDYVFYGDLFFVIFPEYQLSAKEDTITNKQIMEFAKCCYCVNQVGYMFYDFVGDDILSFPVEAVIGDVNLDTKVDLTDAMYINKGLTGEYKLTEGQKKIGDVNGDGKFDILDSMAIRMQLMSEAEQTAIMPALEELKAAKSAIPGDVSKNDKIDLQDSIMIAQSLLGRVKLSKAEEIVADYNANGKVDLHDAIDITKFLLKKNSTSGDSSYVSYNEVGN